MTAWHWSRFRPVLDVVGRQVRPGDPPWKYLHVALEHRNCRGNPKYCQGFVNVSQVDTRDKTPNLTYCLIKRRGSVLLLYMNRGDSVHVHFDKRYELWAIEPASKA